MVVKKVVSRKEARKLYVQDALPLSVICARLNVTERTVSRWKTADAANGDDWDKARIAKSVSKERIEKTTQESLEAFLVYHSEVLEELKTKTDIHVLEKVAAITSLADAYTKHLRACSITAPTLNQLAIAGDVIQKLAAFVAEKHPEAAPLLLSVLEPFGAELAKTYG